MVTKPIQSAPCSKDDPHVENKEVVRDGKRPWVGHADKAK